MKINIAILFFCLFMPISLVWAELVQNGDGTVTDTDTGLMWQQLEGGHMTWEDALDYCETLELAGFSDWRLPNVNELQSIVDYQQEDPSTNSTVLPEVESQPYWSSTTLSSNNECAWVVSFYGGDISYEEKIHSSPYVRAVRGGN